MNTPDLRVPAFTHINCISQHVSIAATTSLKAVEMILTFCQQVTKVDRVIPPAVNTVNIELDIFHLGDHDFHISAQCGPVKGWFQFILISDAENYPCEAFLFPTENHEKQNYTLKHNISGVCIWTVLSLPIPMDYVLLSEGSLHSICFKIGKHVTWDHILSFQYRSWNVGNWKRVIWSIETKFIA